MRLTIRKKLILLFVLAMAVIACFTMFATTMQSKYAMKNAVMKNAETTMEIAVNYIEKNLDQYIQILEEVAGNEVFRAEYVDAEKAAEVTGLCEENNGFDRVGYTDADGINMAGLDFSGREYFIRCKSTKKPVISELYTSQANIGVRSILFAAPIIKENGEFGGIVYTAADAELLSEAISNIYIGESSSVIILDKNGTVIAAQEKTLVADECNFTNGNNTSEYDTEKMAEISKLMIAGKSGTDIYDEGNNSYFSMYRPICQDNGWSIIIMGNLRDFMSGFYKGVQVIFAAVAVLCLLVVLVIFFMTGMITGPIVCAVKRMQGIAEGDFHSPMKHVKTKDETMTLAKSINKTVDSLNEVIAEVSNDLEKMAEGDFSIKVEGEFRGDMLPVRNALDKILADLRGLLQEISTTSSQVLFGSKNVSELAESLAATVTEQTTIMDSIRNNVENVAGSANSNSKKASDTAEIAREAMGYVEEGKRTMEELIAAMETMEKNSQAIEQINKTVADIAFQTNILALNASVEAARAGEAGKGFAVVAEEVRSLASKSAEASKNASDLITETVNSIRNGMEIAIKTSSVMENVVSSTKEVDENIISIAQMSKEQMDSLENVKTSISEIADALTSTAASSQQSSATAEELNAQAVILEKLMSSFTM